MRAPWTAPERGDMTATVEDLKVREAELKARQASLVAQWENVAGRGTEPAKTRDALRRQLDELADERRRIDQEIVTAKEEAKRDGLHALQVSPEYQAAITAALKGLAEELRPYLSMIELTRQAQRRGFVVLAPPVALAKLYLETANWLQLLVRRGIVAERDVPAALRPLMELKL
jgi:hypothetical protein